MNHCMRKFSQIAGIKLKQLTIVTIFMGLCMPTFAQTPSLPALPQIPSAPAAPLPPMPGAVNTNSQSTTNPTLPAGAPPGSVVKPMQASQAKTAVADAMAKNKALTEQVKGMTAAMDSEEGSKQVMKAMGINTATPPSGTSLPPMTGLPALPMPGAMPTPPAIPSMAQPVIDQPATTLPDVQVNREKPKQKTWMTKLAPSYVPVQTNFNYKRVILPELVYSDSYDKNNAHLPTRMTREDYEAILFASVEHNDLTATRALLNAGTAINATNESGETPLAAANRAGAMEVAALLTARGGK